MNIDNIKLPILPNYVQYYIVLIVCNHINSIYKSLESTRREFKYEDDNNALVITIATVNKNWFRIVSDNLKVSINFNYNQNIYQLFKKQIQSNHSTLHSSIINNNSGSNNSGISNSGSNNNEYYLYKYNNITTIKFDFYTFWGGSLLYKRIITNGNILNFYFPWDYALDKIKELPNLKRIILRISSNDKRPMFSQGIPIQLLVDSGIKDIRISDICINEMEFDTSNQINRINSIIVTGYDEDILYNKIKYYNKYLKKLIIYTDTGPFKELAGISTSQSPSSSTMVLSSNEIHNRLGAPPISIDYNVNYLSNITEMNIHRSLSFKDLLTILDSTPNIQKLKLVVCFNLMVYALSSSEKMYSIIYKKGYHCSQCSYGSDYSPTAIKYKTQLVELFPLIIDAFKFKKSNLSHLVLNHTCEQIKNDKRYSGHDTINSKYYSSLSIFPSLLIQLLSSIQNLKYLTIKGVKNKLLFNQINSALSNLNQFNFK